MGEVEVKILDIEHVDDRTRALDIINNMWVYRNIEVSFFETSTSKKTVKSDFFGSFCSIRSSNVCSFFSSISVSIIILIIRILLPCHSNDGTMRNQTFLEELLTHLPVISLFTGRFFT
ncbi:hypothetical protein Y032_0004g1803 [Ancylostoma ceylanicum]|uniref:Uncharacterized protein n=1 Tax=Ancylostoma ceylanicum TaxID=53326 RepID=A0A016VTV5_9BILA|nr:hypothetical protein Y032_0004g1803 [Ancylostoma ceylanicum]